MSSSSESIPMAKMAISPRQSTSLDEEERDTLLTHPKDAQSARTGAIWQILAFTAVGLLIALASAAFAYTLRTHNPQSSNEFVHVVLPDMSDPSLLKYFGGMGPYIGGEYNAPPSQCKISQVHMMARHGERYPTSHMGANIIAFAKNVSSAGKNNFMDVLEFLNTWTLTSPDNWLNTPDMQLEQETLTGPAAGSTHMFTLGSEFRSRYGNLWDFNSAHHGDGGVKVWSSDSVRVIHSAKYFASAFFGVDVPTQMEVIPETEGRWGDSLTTTDSCPAFKRSEYNASYGFSVAAKTYLKTFLPKVTQRLNEMSKEYKFTDADTLAMSQICPFQINALGHSPFCDIFTKKEWKNFNYARDLATYYASGPGNPFGQVMGQPWVNAVLDLMNRNTSSNHNLYFSFSHDTDIVPIIPALGIFPAPNKHPLPWDTYDSDRVFWTTSIVPMGGHVVVERLDCSRDSQETDTRVRVLVNGRIQSVPGCMEIDSFKGTGVYSLDEFEKVVRGRWEKRFCDLCGDGMEGCVDGISFYES